MVGLYDEQGNINTGNTTLNLIMRANELATQFIVLRGVRLFDLVKYWSPLVAGTERKQTPLLCLWRR